MAAAARVPRVSGAFRVPGDKSISHRALMLGALATGESRIRGVLRSADVHSTAAVLRALGVSIPDFDADVVTITGVGRAGLRASAARLECGNSGTTARLMAGILAASPFTSTLTGDASLSRRPMRRVAAPLTAMGATLETSAQGGLPMTIRGGALQGITWHSEHASAQVKSAILLAGLVADVPVEVHERAATRDHTERMLRARGIDVRSEGTSVARQLRETGGHEHRGRGAHGEHGKQDKGQDCSAHDSSTVFRMACAALRLAPAPPSFARTPEIGRAHV